MVPDHVTDDTRDIWSVHSPTDVYLEAQTRRYIKHEWFSCCQRCKLRLAASVECHYVAAMSDLADVNDKVCARARRPQEQLSSMAAARVMVAFTGISGSGKSSLAFGTLYAEAQRRYFESVAPYARRLLQQVGALHVQEITGLPQTISLAAETRTGHVALERRHHYYVVELAAHALFACGNLSRWSAAPGGRRLLPEHGRRRLSTVSRTR